LRTFLRTGAWIGHCHPAAGMAALPPGLVPRDLRVCLDRHDGVPPGRAAVDRRPVQDRRRREMTALSSFLEVKDVRKHYGAIKAVGGVSLSVGPGEIVGVIGPNGSGKTTLFNSILGQIKPTAGNGEVCGARLTHSEALRVVAA